MVPDSVIQKMTKEEKLYYLSALEENNKVLQEKNDIIDKLSNKILELKTELEMLESSKPANHVQEMNETADFLVKNKEIVLEKSDENSLIVKVLRIGMDNNLDDESLKDLVFNALSLFNKFSLMNKIKGTESEENIIIP